MLVIYLARCLIFGMAFCMFQLVLQSTSAKYFGQVLRQVQGSKTVFFVQRKLPYFGQVLRPSTSASTEGEMQTARLKCDHWVAITTVVNHQQEQGSKTVFFVQLNIFEISKSYHKYHQTNKYFVKYKVPKHSSFL